MEAAGLWHPGFIWPSSHMLSSGYSLMAAPGDEEEGRFMHHGRRVPVYTGQSSSELRRPLCPTSYVAQSPLLMASWLLPATSCKWSLGITLQ